MYLVITVVFTGEWLYFTLQHLFPEESFAANLESPSSTIHQPLSLCQLALLCVDQEGSTDPTALLWTQLSGWCSGELFQMKTLARNQRLPKVKLVFLPSEFPNKNTSCPVKLEFQMNNKKMFSYKYVLCIAGATFIPKYYSWFIWNSNLTGTLFYVAPLCGSSGRCTLSSTVRCKTIKWLKQKKMSKTNCNKETTTAPRELAWIDFL